MSDHPARKLGCKRSDPHKLQALPWFDHYLVASALPPLPQYVDWSVKLTQPLGMMCNDRLGCCVISAQGHAIQHFTAAQGNEVTPPDSEIEAMYLGATGGVDEGMQISDGVELMIKTGLSGHKYLAELALSPHNIKALKYGVYMYGGIFFGVSLTEESLHNTAGVWDIPQWVRPRQRGMYQPDPDLGHCVYCYGFDAQGNMLIDSWGMKFKVTPRYLGACMNEARIVIPADWNDADQKAPNALDWKTLVADFPAIAHAA